MLSRRHAVRALITVGVGVALLFGPLVGQVFGVRTIGAVPKWRMFTGIGRDVCQVEYTMVAKDGTRHRVDHHALLRWPRRTKSGRAVGIKKDTLPRVSARMCWALGGARAAVDLRLRARCGSRRRWVDRSMEETSVCQ